MVGNLAMAAEVADSLVAAVEAADSQVVAAGSVAPASAAVAVVAWAYPVEVAAYHCPCRSCPGHN